MEALKEALVSFVASERGKLGSRSGNTGMGRSVATADATVPDASSSGHNRVAFGDS